MGALPDPTGPARVEHLLHLVEDLGSDERFVSTLVVLSPIGDQADVVPVTQQVAERVERDRGTGREPLGGPGMQTCVGQRRD